MPFTYKSNIPLFLDLERKALTETLFRGASDYQEDVEDSMADAKHGRQYKSLPRRSSAPGEAPAVQSGALQASVKIDPESAGSLRYAVYSADEIALIMEYGARLKYGVILPRPAWEPAAHRAEAKLPKKMESELAAATQRASL